MVEDERDPHKYTFAGSFHANNEAEVWEYLKKHFPDLLERFITPSGLDHSPNSPRFPCETDDGFVYVGFRIPDNTIVEKDKSDALRFTKAEE